MPFAGKKPSGPTETVEFSERHERVNKADAAKLQGYLRRKFANAGIKVTPMKNGDTAEVFIGDESIGTISDDKEDGDDSFVFRMAILDIDLEEE